MKTNNDQKPAFHSPTGNAMQDGALTMRDWFAGQAVAGLCSNMKWMENVHQATGSCDAEQKTVTKNYQDTDGFFVVQFGYDDAWFSRPATMPEGVPHYDATITVFRVVDGKTERVCEPWRGVFTDGKCYEDNLADLVAKALKTANKEVDRD